MGRGSMPTYTVRGRRRRRQDSGTAARNVGASVGGIGREPDCGRTGADRFPLPSFPVQSGRNGTGSKPTAAARRTGCRPVRFPGRKIRRKGERTREAIFRKPSVPRGFSINTIYENDRGKFPRPFSYHVANGTNKRPLRRTIAAIYGLRTSTSRLNPAEDETSGSSRW